MKKLTSAYLLFLVIFSILSCKNQENKNSEIINPSKISESSKTQDVTKEEEVKITELIKTPATFSILNEIEGDLDKDGIVEKIIVYDTEKETDFGTERQIHVYKKNKKKWELWEKSTTAVLTSEQGGMMGDPFEAIFIDKNCIVIKHFGGSRQKWNYTHRFRFQNGGFKLIGATISNGSPCEYFETLDYNLSNGNINYIRETEDCESKSSKADKKEMVIKLDTLPTLNGFFPGSNKLTFPKSEITFYY